MSQLKIQFRVRIGSDRIVAALPLCGVIYRPATTFVSPCLPLLPDFIRSISVVHRSGQPLTLSLILRIVDWLPHKTTAGRRQRENAS